MAKPYLDDRNEAPVFDASHAPASGFDDTELLNQQRQRIREDNDMIVCIAPSSRTEGSGTGKTTLGIRLCRWFDMTPSGWCAEEKASLDSEVVAEALYPDLEDGSAILYDEAQGTLDSDGVDARRAMANAVVRMSRSAAQHRTKHHTLVMVTQSTRWIDSRMMDIIDRLLLIQERNFVEEWARAISFDHYYDDLGEQKNEYTPAIEEIYWKPIPITDPDYEQIEALKLSEAEEQTVSDGDDAEPEEEQFDADEINRRRQIKTALKLVQPWDPNRGFSAEDVAAGLDYGESWVSERCREWRKHGKHDDLIDIDESRIKISK